MGNWSGFDARRSGAALSETRTDSTFNAYAALTGTAALAGWAELQLKMDDNAANPTVTDAAAGRNQTFTDAGGNPYTSAHTTAGKVGSALSFDGVDDRINMGAALDGMVGENRDFSVAFWWSRGDANTENYRFIFRKDATDGSIFAINGYWASPGAPYTAFYVYRSSEPNDRVLLYVATNYGWNHYVFQRKGSRFELWCNGQKISENVTATNTRSFAGGGYGYVSYPSSPAKGAIKRGTKKGDRLFFALTFWPYGFDNVLMARFARVVLTDLPYHVTHRGNRRDDVFFAPEDRDQYRQWLREYADRYGLEIWAYCLMTNHVHFIATPRRPDSLAQTIGRAHMRHARRVNRNQGWSGHLWANRFYSTALDEEHLWTAVKCVELNPVRARLVERGEHYPWSSAKAHVDGVPDPLLSTKRPFPDFERVGDWDGWLASGLDEAEEKLLRANTYTGRPTGGENFVAKLEHLLGRLLRPEKRGRKARKERE